MRVFNPKANVTELHTDASLSGLGAMLFQADKEGEKLKLVYALSRKTSESERPYHSTRLELMAIVWALEKLRSFLIGIKFVIVTDCQCLINLNEWKTQNPQIARWVSAISDYDFDVNHKKGELMQHADALSRAPVDEPNERLENGKIFSIATREDEILVFQKSDPSIKIKIDILNKNEKDRSKTEKDIIKNYVLREGLLYKQEMRDDGLRELYVVPAAMRKMLLIRYHDLGSHFGVKKRREG